MTADPVGAGTAGTRIEVVGVDSTERERVRLPLGHGLAPASVLAAHGWRSLRPVGACVRSENAGHVLSLSFLVGPLVGSAVREPAWFSASAPPAGSRALPPLRDDALETRPDEEPVRVQRVAAYAVVTGAPGFLMTEFSDRTSAPGTWGLPGGGIDPGEEPRNAVSREVWEETGQVVEVGDLAAVVSSHWLGRAPSGRLEDFHAVRLLYRAVCPQPADPVVHDIGGTTESAAWLTADSLALLELTPGWRAMMLDLGMPVGTVGDDRHTPSHTER